RRRQAREALELLTKPVIEEWLGKQPKLLPNHKRYLEEALAVYQEFAAETATDEASRAGLAKAYCQIGDIQRILGQVAEAEEAYNRSEELYTQLLAETGGRPEYRKMLIRIANHRIKALQTLGRGPQAHAALRDMVQLQKQWGVEALDSEGRSWLAVSLNN